MALRDHLRAGEGHEAMAPQCRAHAREVFSYRDIALVLSTDEAPVTRAVVRKRFQRLKLRIRAAPGRGRAAVPP